MSRSNQGVSGSHGASSSHDEGCGKGPNPHVCYYHEMWEPRKDCDPYKTIDTKISTSSFKSGNYMYQVKETVKHEVLVNRQSLKVEKDKAVIRCPTSLNLTIAKKDDTSHKK